MITKLQFLAQRMLSSGGGELQKIRPICFCGPSGSGKSTLLKRLMAEHPDAFAYSTSHTTRNPRPGEVNGKDYHFVSREEMLMAIENNEFLEYAEFSGNMYGTSKKSVENVLTTGKVCALDIDIQGVKNLKKTNLNAIYCFIKTPNLDDLEKRLRSRGTETEESLRRRLDTAKIELDYEQSDKLAFDYVIINDDLENAYQKLKSILRQHVAQLKPSN